MPAWRLDKHASDHFIAIQQWSGWTVTSPISLCQTKVVSLTKHRPGWTSIEYRHDRQCPNVNGKPAAGAKPGNYFFNFIAEFFFLLEGLSSAFVHGPAFGVLNLHAHFGILASR
ncbi:MAG: hypothetical protein U0V75_06845 [Ferruginibacter sp.]